MTRQAQILAKDSLHDARRNNGVMRLERSSQVAGGIYRYGFTGSSIEKKTSYGISMKRLT